MRYGYLISLSNDSQYSLTPFGAGWNLAAQQFGAPDFDALGGGITRMDKQVFTVEEVAARLRIGRGTAYDAVRRGEIPVIRIGRRLLVPRAALARMLAAADGDTTISDDGKRPKIA